MMGLPIRRIRSHWRRINLMPQCERQAEAVLLRRTWRDWVSAEIPIRVEPIERRGVWWINTAGWWALITYREAP